MSVEYRPADAKHLKFVVYSWVRSFRDSHAAGLIAYDDWRDVMTPQIAKVLRRPGVEVVVAAHPTDTEVDLYGWIAVERGFDLPLVHYVYVKRPYRRMGFARALFAAAGVNAAEPFQYTCKTRTLTENRRDPLIRKAPRARWNPLLARKPKGRENDATESNAQAQADQPPSIPSGAAV